MSSLGAVKVINVQNKPQLISLSTIHGRSDSALNDVTWSMQESIGVLDQNFTAVVSLYSMIFYNTFNNITTGNNTLEIISQYEDANGAAQETLITVNVPQGHYDINTILAYLNTDGICNDLLTINTVSYYLGLGVYGNTTFPPFAISPSNPSKIVFQPPTAGGAGALGTYNANHVYTGFYLLVNDDTKGLLNKLGLLEYDQNGTIANTLKITGNRDALGFACQTGGATTPYSYEQPYQPNAGTTVAQYESPNSIDFGSPVALAISWEQVAANTRNSFNALTSGDTISIVPINTAYGYKNIYQPSVPFKCVVPNFNINQFRITVRDAATGAPVDFQGNNWLLTLCIEFYEIDNSYKSEAAQSGIGRTVHSSSHTSVRDHNLPFSGMVDYSRLKRMRGGAGENGL